jgi:hypothetical protein
LVLLIILDWNIWLQKKLTLVVKVQWHN